MGNLDGSDIKSLEEANEEIRRLRQIAKERRGGLVCRTVPGGGVTRSVAIQNLFVTQITVRRPLY